MTSVSKPAAAVVPSPCVSLCKINQDTELCEGCWRSLDEIIAWGTASDAYKLEVWQRIDLRKATPGLTSQ